MTKPRVLFICAFAVAALLAAVLVHALLSGPPDLADAVAVDRLPRIFPDYTGTVIPANIAPLNFLVKEPGTRYFVAISSTRGEPVEVLGTSPGIVIPVKPWKRLLDANRGEDLFIDVCVRDDAGHWQRFRRVVNAIARENIDPYLVYRDMPVYNLVWSDMGIYERHLETFAVRPVLQNRFFGHGCVNCHTFLKGRSQGMLMNVRGATGSEVKGGMVIARDGVVQKVVNTSTEFNAIPAIYLAWHPSGRAVSFSSNKVMQCFHTRGDARDVIDQFSDAALYLIESNTVTTTPEISRPDRLETYTTWAPDGNFMYYCSAPQLPVSRYKETRYDLMRIAYDIDTDTWGKPEVVLAAGDTGLSNVLPRISPDGRFLLFCTLNFGNFAAFNRTSDLWMLELKTGKHRRLDISSDHSDAYHSWSSNSRWIVFSSKRLDGLFARPYISYVEETGRAHKPFILPQKDPAFYESCTRIYNVPELVAEPVALEQRELARALHAPERQTKAQLDPRVPPRTPHAPPPTYIRDTPPGTFQ